MDESNHPDWFNKGPWYNTDICSKLHGILLEDLITHARTDRYNIMCYIVAHDKKQPTYEYYEIIIVHSIIPKHLTTETLEALGATFIFINISIKRLGNNYDAIRVAYSTAMKNMLTQIPTTMMKPLSQRQKAQKLMT